MNSDALCDLCDKVATYHLRTPIGFTFMDRCWCDDCFPEYLRKTWEVQQEADRLKEVQSEQSVSQGVEANR